MDTFLAVASIRVVRHYQPRAVSDEDIRRILEAGRATGSSQNRQQWRFYVVRDRATLERLSTAVYAPENVAGCGAAIGLTSSAKSGFDIGRCAQNMMLTGWNDGIGSCPNGIKDVEAAGAILGVSEDESLTTIISFGYPARPINVQPGGVEGVLERIDRKPLDEVVVWVDEAS